MADAAPTAAEESLHNTSHIPIAQLTPLLSSPTSRSISAVVTLVWPYSSVTNTLTVGLAEPDFRLRRTRGQVRVQFSGSSAKRVKDSGLGSGDKVLLSLTGAEWVKRDASISTPGRDIEWELKYTERLLLEIQDDSKKITFIDVDHPSDPIPSIEAIISVLTSEPEPPTPPPVFASSRPSILEQDPGEYASPAFIKRARISYGSLVDTELDFLTEEDGAIKGKGRKRARLSTMSHQWRYSSRSPSVEAENDTASVRSSTVEGRLVVIMMDEGCQTDDLPDFSASVSLANPVQATAVVGEPRILNVLQSYDEESMKDEWSRPTITITPGGETFSAQVGQRHDDTPVSPRLQPISSDGLPMVSPLATRGFSEFDGLENGELHPLTQPWAMMSERTEDIPAVQELYEASSMHDKSVPRTANHHFTGLQAIADAAQFDEQYGELSESRNEFVEVAQNDSMGDGVHYANQYGRWHGDNMNSGTHSPFVPEVQNQPSVAETDTDHHRTQNGPYFTQDTTAGFQEQIYGYPAISEDLVQPPSGWGADVMGALYPHATSVRPTRMPPPIQSERVNTHLEDKSRSQSVHSEVVDLTEESADEEDADGDDEIIEDEVAAAGHVRDEAGDAEIEEGFEGDEEEAEGIDYASQEEVDVQSQLGIAETRPKYDSEGFRVFGEAEDYEEENEGLEQYDQDDMSEQEEDSGGEPFHPSAPVVIDLLSDSEDEAESAPAPQQQYLLRGHSGSEEEFDEEEEEEAEEEEEGGEGGEEDAEYEINKPSKSVVRSQNPDIVAHPLPFSDEEESYEEDADKEEIEDEDMDDTAHANSSRPGDKAAVTSPIAVAELLKTKEAGDDMSVDAEPASPYSNPSTFWTMPRRKSHDTMGFDGASDQVSDSSSVNNAHQVAREAPVAAEQESENVPYQTVESPSQRQESSLTQHGQIPLSQETFGDGNQNAEPLLEVTDAQLPTPADTQVEDVRPDRTDSQVAAAGDAKSSTQLPQEAPEVRKTRSHTRGSSSDAVSIEAVKASQSEAGTQQLHATVPQDMKRVTRSASVANKEPSVHYTTSEPQASDGDDEAESIIVDPKIHGKEAKRATRSVSVALKAPPVEALSSTSLHQEASKEVSSEQGSVAEAARQTRASARLASMDPQAAAVEDDKSSLNVEGKAGAPEAARVTRASKKIATMTDIFVPPATPVRSSRRGGPTTVEQSPSFNVDTLTTTTIIAHGHDASAALAYSALNSPTETFHSPGTPATPSTKIALSLQKQLSKDLKSNLPSFTELKSIRYVREKKADLLVIATTPSSEPKEAAKFPRHYLTRFCILDNSTPGTVFDVQLFRPHVEALPVVEAGDVLLLHGLEVKPDRSSFAFRSTGESSWVVFKSEIVDGKRLGHLHGLEQVRGPPVEFGDEERQHVKSLRGWYEGLGAREKSKIEKAVKAKGGTN